MHNLEALKSALKQRKGKGIDISIMLGAPKDEDSEKLGLAPDMANKHEMALRGEPPPAGQTTDEHDQSAQDEDDAAEHADGMGSANDDMQNAQMMHAMLNKGPMGKRGMMFGKK